MRRHDIAGIWVAFFSACQRYRCGQGGPGSYTDPNFGYRYKNGSMTAGTLRVIFELGEVSQQDGGTQFILGSYAQPTILSFTSLWRPAPDELMFCAGTKQISRWRRLSCGGARRRFST